MLPFQPISGAASDIRSLFTVVLIIGAIILLLVTVLVVYSSIRFRARKDEPEPRQIFGVRRLELFWTVSPAVLLGGILIYTIFTMYRVAPNIPVNEAPDLMIVGHQWWWEFRYPKLGVVTANELHLPKGQKFVTEVTSADVIHSFWVPQLGQKLDATPGRPAYMYIQADQVGTYLGSCVEYCGTAHAWMRIRVIVEEPQNFDAWVKQQAAIPTIPTTGAAGAGAKLFTELTCAQCHTIAGTTAKGTVGPNLTYVSTRETIAAGAAENTQANLEIWIDNPQVIKPGVHMPSLGLSANQISDLAAFLEALK
ncbi:MAG: cytochrome c oxidase subunit II [Chloroflexi bacterium]|nr:cytochrome c oxidase subunit II [Chloroflexota bacterium]